MARMTALALLLCALIATASPLPAKKRSNVHSIQGNVRRSFAERAAARGLSNREFKRLERAKVQSKYARNVALAQRHQSINAKRQSATLQLTDFIQQGVDELYYAGLGVGTPAQNITVDFDTGSADLWVPNTQCSNCIDDGTLFNTAASSTYKQTNTPFEIQYGSGAVEGSVASDVVAFGNFSTMQSFGSVVRVTDTFDDSPASGLCGLAFQSISTIGQPNIAFALASELGHKVFGFHLTTDQASGSTLTLGGVASNYSTANFSYTPVTSQTYWEVASTGLYVNGQNVYSTGFPAAIDTGTTTAYIPTAAAKAFYAAIPNSQEIEQGEYVFPCSFSGTVGVSFSGISTPISINVADLSVGEYAQGYCEGAISGADITDANGAAFAILGDTFLKNVYSVFDFGSSPPRVGFTTA